MKRFFLLLLAVILLVGLSTALISCKSKEKTDNGAAGGLDNYKCSMDSCLKAKSRPTGDPAPS